MAELHNHPLLLSGWGDKELVVAHKIKMKWNKELQYE